MLKCLSSILVFVFLGLGLKAQNSNHQLVSVKAFTEARFNNKEVHFMDSKKKTLWAKYNPLSLTLGGMMFFYQKVISQQIAANCPYEVSCSAFSKECIKSYGLIKGVLLSADRLTRCTRLAAIDMKAASISEKSGRLFDPPSLYK